jgi:hypothetical protein
MSNGYGEYKTTPAEDQAAHDLCPPRIRFALNYAVSPVAAKPVLEYLDFGFSEQSLIEGIKRADRSMTRETYGPQHPEAARD